jgi:hypothetical protein
MIANSPDWCTSPVSTPVPVASFVSLMARIWHGPALLGPIDRISPRWTRRHGPHRDEELPARAMLGFDGIVELRELLRPLRSACFALIEPSASAGQATTTDTGVA